MIDTGSERKEAFLRHVLFSAEPVFSFQLFPTVMHSVPRAVATG